MEAVFAASLVFPTVVFSLLISLVLVYWLFVLLGALDIDALDIDADLEVDADVDVDGEAMAGKGLFADWLSRLDLTEVPLTVTLSLFALVAWLTCFALVEVMGAVATAMVVGSGIAVLSSLLALIVTSRCARFLKPLFRTHYAPTNRSFVGRVCEIATLRVDDRYGQAEVADGGAGLLIQVRSSNAQDLVRGCKALIFDYDDERKVFFVKPISDGDAELANAAQTA